MTAELHPSNENNVLIPIMTSLPHGRKSVTSKWVFAIKRNERGILLRYKARLVARGFTQKKGIDYDRTFAPVMKQSLLRAVLAEANHEDWNIDQIDIKTAFLYRETPWRHHSPPTTSTLWTKPGRPAMVQSLQYLP